MHAVRQESPLLEATRDTRARTRRLAGVIATLAAAIISVTLAAETARAETLPTSMASLGDSLTRAWGTTGSAGDNPAESWATGDDPAVDSQYRRLVRRTAAIAGHVGNYAVSGSTMASTYDQAGLAVAQGAGYVTVFSGTNDVCRPTAAEMTSVAAFTGQFRSTLARLTSGLPGARIFVLSVPNWYGLWESQHTNGSAVAAWTASGVCAALLSSGASDASRQAVRQRTLDYNAAIVSVCGEFAACSHDHGAVFALDFPSLSLAFDFFHYSVAGQARVAAATWPYAPYATPPGLASLIATPDTNAIRVGWSLPAGATRTRIVGRTGGPPTSPSDGTVVFDGSDASGTRTVSGLASGTPYYVAGWTFDVDGTQGPTVTASATPAGSSSPPPPVVPPVTQPSGGGSTGGGGGSSAPDLAVTISANRTQAAINDQVLFHVDVRLANGESTSGASDLVLTQTLGSNLETLSTTVTRGPGCQGTSTLTCPLGFLAQSLVASVDVLTRVTGPGEIIGIATVRALETDPNQTNNAATVRLNTPVLTPPTTTPPKAAPRLVRPRLTLRTATPVVGRTAAGKTTATVRLLVSASATISVTARTLAGKAAVPILPGTGVGSKTLKRRAPRFEVATAGAKALTLRLVVPSAPDAGSRRVGVLLRVTNRAGSTTRWFVIRR